MIGPAKECIKKLCLSTTASNVGGAEEKDLEDFIINPPGAYTVLEAFRMKENKLKLLIYLLRFVV